MAEEEAVDAEAWATNTEFYYTGAGRWECDGHVGVT